MRDGGLKSELDDQARGSHERGRGENVAIKNKKSEHDAIKNKRVTMMQDMWSKK